MQLAATIVRNSGVLDVSAEESRYLHFGRVVDTTRLVERFGYRPRHDTATTIEQFGTRLAPVARPGLAALRVASQLAGRRLPERVLG
jgi:UDP-glucose 4-epimerase